MDELFRYGLRETVQGLRAGNFTSEEYTRSCLDRIAQCESQVQAFAWLDAEAALAKARAADRTRGESGDCLHGVPLAVKDIIDTAGIPTERGSVVYRGRVPEKSAAVVRRLEGAGGFVLGKTVTAELAYFTPGKTRNPWNLAHTPGGSSSGSAAAVAAGFVPVALGTQTSGSIIRPAAFCGVVGFKSSSGLVSRAGIQVFSPTLDHVGVFTRSVRDAAMLSCCLAGYDEDDPAGVCAPQVLCKPNQSLPALSKPPRIGMLRSAVWDKADSAQRAEYDRVAALLAEAGATLEPVKLSDAFNEASALHHMIMFGEGARGLREVQAKHREQLSDKLNQLVDEGLGIGDDALEYALRRRLQLSSELHQLFRQYDVMLTPPACGEAPATLTQTGDPAFCSLWTLIGVPAVTIPTGLGPHGLPLGMQLVGGYLNDEKLLSVAQWCEDQLGWDARIAEVSLEG